MSRDRAYLADFCRQLGYQLRHAGGTKAAVLARVLPPIRHQYGYPAALW